MKNITKSKTKMIAYMIVVGIMLGWFSAISDNIPATPVVIVQLSWYHIYWVEPSII